MFVFFFIHLFTEPIYSFRIWYYTRLLLWGIFWFHKDIMIGTCISNNGQKPCKTCFDSVSNRLRRFQSFIHGGRLGPRLYSLSNTSISICSWCVDLCPFASVCWDFFYYAFMYGHVYTSASVSACSLHSSLYAVCLLPNLSIFLLCISKSFVASWRQIYNFL